ncbi:hypothetical protein TIFTF001_033180 [Ficus carica]|uniref:Uncharacterized protein n=1 Tax=Ficus carica TaxID=3494 RepID=A0AA88DYG7_FICCA|nr:hypothetical protein TIFTF001_033180 [Ficus carica]
MGDLANAFYPLWGTLQKLERLLALQNREWDDIQVPRRLRASSLWKDFVELPSGIPKRVPSWVDWPFIIRGVLRRLFGTPLFVDPLTDEEALIAEFSLDSLVMEVPTPKDIMAKRRAKKEAERAAVAATAAAAAASAGQVNEPEPFPVLESSPEPPSKPSSPPAKKRKVVEKAKMKIPAKRKLKSKIASPAPDIEGPRVEVILPPRQSLLNDRQASVDIARQLLSEVDAETLTQDCIFILQINVRTTGLLYRLADKVVSQSNKIKELEENDCSRRAKLEDIERKFIDVKSGSEGLMLELQKFMDVAREGTSAMDALVQRFEENQEKVKSLEAENAALASQIMNAFEKATIKARYDILKDYKARLLDEAQIDEEIEKYEEDYPEEVRSLSSVPALAPTDAEPSNVEPPAQANPSEDLALRLARLVRSISPPLVAITGRSSSFLKSGGSRTPIIDQNSAYFTVRYVQCQNERIVMRSAQVCGLAAVKSDRVLDGVIGKNRGDRLHGSPSMRLDCSYCFPAIDRASANYTNRLSNWRW